MKLIQDILVSRKAQGLLLLVLVVLLGGQVGLDSDQVTLTAEGLMAYILGRAIHDNGLSKS
ncbi:MAG: hypothetical protein ABGY10_03735 [bacterium]|nr:MAG: hypothetical protein CXT65_05100 [Euryarchaeota archaeon]